MLSKYMVCHVDVVLCVCFHFVACCAVLSYVLLCYGVLWLGVVYHVIIGYDMLCYDML